MRVIDIIRKKRDGAELSREEIEFIVSGFTRDQFPEYQMAAWLMAVFVRGMSRAERTALTESMLHSGSVLDFSDLPAPKVDKHSTGGVGDKTSLVLAPVVAAAGLYVPMISGRGLGHSGGTLDKLESIPGFNVNLSLVEFRRVLEKCGCGLIGQTPEIAPADKKIYALRDVTSTVESQPLICASIMCKKMAEGIDALVLDVKTGSGAFMKKMEDSVSLAELMVEVGQRMGKKVVALITDMNQPLGRKVGNALEVEECVEVMRGEGPEDLREICLVLSAWMLFLGGKSKSVESGKQLAAEMIASGKALEKFREIVRLQGGDAGVIDDTRKLPQAKHRVDVVSTASGTVTAIACEQLGVASLVLGGGREKKEDRIDPAVGLLVHKKIGDRVEKGQPLCTIHYNADGRLAEARSLIESAYVIGSGKADAPPLVYKTIGA
ncbi:MAG: thymidine phosphorylase [Acidobacteria bacterium]|nr:thymidine phosphorylase [Acidobacteriota bacterium]